MTNENPFSRDRVEQPLANIFAGTDLAPLPNERLQVSSTADSRPIADSTGNVSFPPVYGAQRSEIAAPASPNAPTDQPASHDYTVKSGDSLWKIAKDSLSHGNRHMHFQGEEIWDRMREIIAASGVQHPEIKGNPFFIKKGDHLTIPGAAEAPNFYDRSANGSPNHNYQQHDRSHVGRHHRGGNQDDNQAYRPDGTYNGRRDDYSDSRGAVPSGDAHIAKAMKQEAAHQARHIGTVGDCARGPRQTMETFGIKLKPMSAVSQGQLLEQSGMFDVVPAGQAKEGDYGYRHWSAHTIKRRGVGDLGDSFIVTNCTSKGWEAANDHMFQVPPAGGYYAKGITFLRPNAKFYAAVDQYKQTGNKTHIDYDKNGNVVIS